MMVDRLLHLKPAFSYMSHLLPNHQFCIEAQRLPSDFQWKILEQTKRLLRPFRDAQLSLEGDQYITISMVPCCINKCHLHLEKYAAVWPESTGHSCHFRSLGTFVQLDVACFVAEAQQA